MKASIIITTKNRKDELRTAVVSAVRQTGGIEIIIVDDGSTDGTAEMVRQEFPQVRLERSESTRGIVEQRNRGAALASGDIIFSIDDDAEFSAPSIVADTLALFAEPRIGAVAISSIDVHNGFARQVAPDDKAIWITDSFIGTAYAVRRELFLRLGGYRAYFVRQHEERDFCIRLMNEGYIVRLATAQPILHRDSPIRDMRQAQFYGRRNSILFVWLNAPLLNLPFYIVAVTLNGFVRSSMEQDRLYGLAGIAMGYMSSLRYWRERRPVCGKVYRLARRMKKGGPLRLDEGIRMLSEPRRSRPQRVHE